MGKTASPGAGRFPGLETGHGRVRLNVLFFGHHRKMHTYWMANSGCLRKSKQFKEMTHKYSG
jgi:hypothetical protein